jgi:hypothetical protein
MAYKRDSKVSPCLHPVAMWPLGRRGGGATVGVLEPVEKLGGELSKTKANEAPRECVETVLVVQGDEEKVILGVEDKLGHSSADLGRVLDPDAKLHRRESRANALFTNLGKGDAPNEAIPGVPDTEGVRVAVHLGDKDG